MDSEDDADAIERLGCKDILNLILPPKQWENNGVIYCQKLSNQPATNLDVKKLGEKLDMYLGRFNAREVGICPIRRELYSQCFGELKRRIELGTVDGVFVPEPKQNRN